MHSKYAESQTHRMGCALFLATSEQRNSSAELLTGLKQPDYKTARFLLGNA